jgi:hypothetical protein
MSGFGLPTKLTLGGILLTASWSIIISPGLALPPPEDIPEEVQRTEIITEARSPLNGEPLTPADYAELQAELEAGPDTPPEVNPQIAEVVRLLRLRQALNTFFPFLIP